LSDAETILSDLGRDEKDKTRKAEIYVKIMKKVVEEGDEFVGREMARIQKVLAGNLKTDKKKEMQHRLNILKTFNGDLKNDDDDDTDPKTEQDL
jgi:hypothetical protein